MTNRPDCVYDGCDDTADVVREVRVSGRELVYCRVHDPLREGSGVSDAFKER